MQTLNINNDTTISISSISGLISCIYADTPTNFILTNDTDTIAISQNRIIYFSEDRLYPIGKNLVNIITTGSHNTYHFPQIYESTCVLLNNTNWNIVFDTPVTCTLTFYEVIKEN
jgi:hypothetical protein